jgi:hypothetical protein
MRLTRLHALLTVAAVATAGTVTGTALAAAAAPSTPSQVVLVQCNGAGQVRPSGSNQPGCMPSNEFLTGLKWVSWRTVAYGSGTLKVNNCTPSSSCGPSKFTKYSILTVLWRAEPRPKHPGHDYFSRLTIIFTGSGKHRPHGPVAQTMILPAS